MSGPRKPTPAEIGEAQAREAERRADYLRALAKGLIDGEKLIEAGWISLQLAAIPASASAVQIREMRMAFMAGAQHLFSSIINILDPGEEATEADLDRMSLIARELDAFAEELKRDGRFQ